MPEVGIVTFNPGFRRCNLLVVLVAKLSEVLMNRLPADGKVEGKIEVPLSLPVDPLSHESEADDVNEEERSYEEYDEFRAATAGSTPAAVLLSAVLEKKEKFPLVFVVVGVNRKLRKGGPNPPIVGVNPVLSPSGNNND